MNRLLPSRQRSDRGGVLILVLVLVVLAGFIVLPLMSYTMSVLRLNRAVSERTQDIEAAKGGIRVALSDPRHVFLECDGGGSITPYPMVNGHTVTTTCAELDEIGPLEALGFEVPVGAVAVQVGAEVPGTFAGATAQSDPITPYPTTADWWSSLLPVPTGRPPAVLPDDVVELWDAKDGSIWLPELPRWPSAVRSSTPFDMPPGFDCRVFFPGQYADPVDLTSGRYYFASGVYYFENTITVSGDADVIVGYGLEDFGANDCADDLQVAANVVSGPPTFAIDGGGATWVFGDGGRLVVDDSLGGAPRVRFNQRYSDEDRGGRVSIMTVNGNSAGTGDHDVPFVSSVPVSRVLDTTDPDPANDVSDALPILPGTYAPSSSDLTDEARLPTAPASFTAEARQYDDGGAPTGALLLTWDPLTGNDGGGSPISDYVVSITPGAGLGCDSTADLVVTSSGQVSCLITGLSLGTNYDVTVAGVNAEGTSLTVNAGDMPTLSSPTITPPDAPANVTVEETDADDEARVTWDAPADGGAPITGYEVTAERVFVQPGADQPPVASDATVTTTTLTPITFGAPAYDPNGDTLGLTIDSVPAGWTASVSGLDVTLTPDATIAIDAPYTFPYTVTDPGGATASRVINMNFTALGGQPNQAPVAAPMDIVVELGVPFTSRPPAYDPNGDAPLTLTIDDTAFDPGEWTFSSSGLEGTVTTTAPDGVYSTTYTVTDPSGATASNTVTITVARSYLDVGTCSVVTPPSIATTPASPIPTWYELPTSCDIGGLPDLTSPSDLGYQFRIVATNAVGDSSAAYSPPPRPFAFDGGGTATSAPPLATFDPYVPTPIIEILADDPGATLVHIAGYVSVPMGQIHIDNNSGDDIALVGGVIAGTFDVDDIRGSSGDPDTVPIGFRNDIVLQRKVRITATAGNARATAIVQINEDGTSYKINTWVVD